MNYFRITFKGRNHGYWEDVEPEQHEFAFYYELAALCKKQGALPIDEPKILGLLETLSQSDYCPLAFKTLDPILTVHIEYRTVSSVMSY